MMNATLVFSKWRPKKWDWVIVVKGRMRVTDDSANWYPTKASARRGAKKIAKEVDLTITEEVTE